MHTSHIWIWLSLTHGQMQHLELLSWIKLVSVCLLWAMNTTVWPSELCAVFEKLIISQVVDLQWDTYSVFTVDQGKLRQCFMSILRAQSRLNGLWYPFVWTCVARLSLCRSVCTERKTDTFIFIHDLILFLYSLFLTVVIDAITVSQMQIIKKSTDYCVIADVW